MQHPDRRSRSPSGAPPGRGSASWRDGAATRAEKHARGAKRVQENQQQPLPDVPTVCECADQGRESYEGSVDHSKHRHRNSEAGHEPMIGLCWGFIQSAKLEPSSDLILSRTGTAKTRRAPALRSPSGRTNRSGFQLVVQQLRNPGDLGGRDTGPAQLLGDLPHLAGRDLFHVYLAIHPTTARTTPSAQEIQPLPRL